MPLLPNINIGSAPNDGTGANLRYAFQQVNENFQYIEAFFPNTANIGLTANIDSTGVSTFNNVTINNVTSAVTFTTSITASANLTANNISVTNNITADTLNASTIGNIDASIVGDNVSAATIGNSGSVLTGTISTVAQPNITSLGTLNSLNLSGPASISGNVDIVGNIITSSGNIIGSNATVISGVRSVVKFVSYHLDTLTNGNLNLDFTNAGPQIGAWSINGAVTFIEPTEIDSGMVKNVYLYNESGTAYYAYLFNSKNNFGTNTVLVANGTVATINFIATDNTAANIFQTISNV